MPFPRTVLVGVIAGLALVASPALAGDVAVEDAWVRQPPPNASAAAYFRVTNSSDRTRQLLRAESAAAERVELHRSFVEDGVAKMQPVEAVEIPAGGSVAFEPGGLHAMLIGPNPLAVGDAVEMTLILDGDEAVPVSAAVRKGGAGAASGHDHHQHH